MSLGVPPDARQPASVSARLLVLRGSSPSGPRSSASFPAAIVGCASLREPLGSRPTRTMPPQDAAASPAIRPAPGRRAGRVCWSALPAVRSPGWAGATPQPAVICPASRVARDAEAVHQIAPPGLRLSGRGGMRSRGRGRWPAVSRSDARRSFSADGIAGRRRLRWSSDRPGRDDVLPACRRGSAKPLEDRLLRSAAPTGFEEVAERAPSPLKIRQRSVGAAKRRPLPILRTTH